MSDSTLYMTITLNKNDIIINSQGGRREKRYRRK